MNLVTVDMTLPKDFRLRRRFFGTEVFTSDFKGKSVWWFQSWHFDAFLFLLLGATLTCDG